MQTNKTEIHSETKMRRKKYNGHGLQGRDNRRGMNGCYGGSIVIPLKDYCTRLKKWQSRRNPGNDLNFAKGGRREDYGEISGNPKR